MFVDEVKLEMPPLFPAVEFTAFVRSARAILTQPKMPAWAEFAGASNLIAWRFRAAFESLDAYSSSWLREGADVGFEELYTRERAIFAMFTNGVSCVESAVYAAYAFASVELNIPFGLKEQRKCCAETLGVAIAKSVRGASLAKALRDLDTAPEWLRWKELRNRMTHRGNLPRVITGAVGAEPPPAKAFHFAKTSSTAPVEGDLADLNDLAEWLAGALRSLLAAATTSLSSC